MNSAMIRLNIKGRESQGIIEPEDYDKTCEHLTQRLWSLKDTETGEGVVERISNLQKTYEGDRSEVLPDLCVEWKKPLSTKVVKIDDGTEFPLELDFMPEMRQGDHDDSAVFISSNRYQVANNIPLGAIAPTISRTMGVNFPCADEPALKLI